MSLPATWRRKLFPPCPSCRSSGGWAEHRNCPDTVAHKAGRSNLYIDIATGETICLACGQKWGLEDTRHYHKCGAVFDGGEIWQGMAAELGRIGNARWLAAAGIKRGSLDTKMRGWWFCLGCGREASKHMVVFPMGTRRGGCCYGCHLKAESALSSFLRLRGSPDFCSWCGASKVNRKKIVRIRKANMCDQCAAFMAKQPPFTYENWLKRQGQK